MIAPVGISIWVKFLQWVQVEVIFENRKHFTLSNTKSITKATIVCIYRWRHLNQHTCDTPTTANPQTPALVVVPLIVKQIGLLSADLFILS